MRSRSETGSNGAAARWRPMSVVISGRLPRSVAVLREERLLERWLSADEIEELVVGGFADDRRDRAGDAELQRLALGRDVADAGDRREGSRRDLAREPQLDLVMSEIAQGLDPVHLGEPSVADDRDAIAGLLDLAEDVAREEDRPALGLGLADDLVEGLLDERIETRRGLVEDQQVRPMLEGDDQPDLL